MDSKVTLFSSSSYDKAKLVTYKTKSYPKNDNSGRWVVEYYDLYSDGTEKLTRTAECDENDVDKTQYLLSR